MRAAFLAFACALALAPAGLLRAEDAPQKGAAARIAWFERIADARKAAQETGRPLFIAVHVRPRVLSKEAAVIERLQRWSEVYGDPALVALSRRYACVQRVIQAPEDEDPAAEPGPAALHMVVDGTSRVLAQLAVDRPDAGEAGVEQLRAVLRAGLKHFGPIAPGAPLIDPRRVARTRVDLTGISPSKPVGVPHGVPGVRLRLKWELPAPALSGADTERVRASVRMRWDGEGPFDVGAIAFGPGEEIDVPVDLRFDEIEGLAELATKGTHRVDLYLEPLPGSYPFSQGPLHVGRVWIDLGAGGGGGGASSDNQEDAESEQDTPPKPQPQPEDGEAALPPPPPPEREEVVDPFVGEGETIDKDDAVVAVEDPDGGVEPPRQLPLEEALREFEKRKEREISREGISARERAFLKRYFELLERAVKGKAGK